MDDSTLASEASSLANGVASSIGAMQLTLCLGSNYGRRRESIEEALAWLSQRLTCFRYSPVYETPAYGQTAGGPYLNVVAVGTLYPDMLPAASRTSEPHAADAGASGEYTLSAEEALQSFEAECKRYELEHGRDAEARRNNHVIIDIDIVIAGKKILRPGDYRCSFFQIGYSALQAPTKSN